MQKSCPRPLAAAVVIVLTLFCITVVTQLFAQTSLEAAIAHKQDELDATRRRLEKQLQEYDEALARLPIVQSEVEEAQPLAQAAYDQEQALRAQRKALRSENADLADQLAALQAESEEALAQADALQQAAAHLQSALDDLADLPLLTD